MGTGSLGAPGHQLWPEGRSCEEGLGLVKKFICMVACLEEGGVKAHCLVGWGQLQEGRLGPQLLQEIYQWVLCSWHQHGENRHMAISLCRRQVSHLHQGVLEAREVALPPPKKVTGDR